MMYAREFENTLSGVGHRCHSVNRIVAVHEKTRSDEAPVFGRRFFAWTLPKGTRHIEIEETSTVRGK